MITSLQNSKIKQLAAYGRKRRDRVEAGVMVVEGHDELLVAVDSGVKPVELFICLELMGPTAESDLLPRLVAAGAEMTELSRPVFEKVAYREGPDGWLAVVPAVETRLERLEVGETPLVLVCEAIEKPGNLGAMLRTAAAVGADAVIVTGGVVDFGNPNVIRASKGAVFTVPVAEAQNAELLAWLRERDIRLVAAAPRTAVPMWEADLRSGGVAIAVGAEHEGLSAELLEAAAARVEIPMARKLDSLNASISAALLLYEGVRQRQGLRIENRE